MYTLDYIILKNYIIICYRNILRDTTNGYQFHKQTRFQGLGKRLSSTIPFIPQLRTI